MKTMSLLQVVLILSLAACGRTTVPPAASATTGVQPTPATVEPEQVAEVARQGLPNWLQHVGAEYRRFGFKDARELELATLGTPYEVYALSPQAVQAYKPGDRVAELVTPLHTWEVPVLVHGEARGILTVAYHDGRWQTVQYGGGIDSYSRNVVALQKRLAGSTAVVKLLAAHPIHSNFALIEEGGRESLVFLNPSGFFATLDEKALTPYPPEELMPEIAKVFAQQPTRGN